MKPFQVFRKLLHEVGLFGNVSYTEAEAIGLGKPALSSEEIAQLAINNLTLEERDVLITALSIKNLEKTVDAERNKQILIKAGVDITPKVIKSNSNLIKPSPEAVTEILEEMTPEKTDGPDMEKLIEWAVNENHPLTELIGTLEFEEESKDISHSSK